MPRRPKPRLEDLHPDCSLRRFLYRRLPGKNILSRARRTWKPVRYRSQAPATHKHRYVGSCRSSSWQESRFPTLAVKTGEVTYAATHAHVTSCWKLFPCVRLIAHARATWLPTTGVRCRTPLDGYGDPKELRFVWGYVQQSTHRIRQAPG